MSPPVENVTGSLGEPKVLRARGFEDLVHGFTTRLGGVSAGAYASLNLGRATGDDAAAVEENHRIAAAAGRFRVEDLVTPRVQVHGAAVETIDAALRVPEECDALTTATPGVAVGIRVADCVPILLWDPVENAVAAVHAGWRGIAARIPLLAVRAMVARHRTRPERLRAAIGPAIGPCCYEVGSDVAQQVTGVAEMTPRFAVMPVPGGPIVGDLKVRLDLRAAASALLLEAGLENRHVETVGGCTSCEATLFFSHRRDKGVTGRHLAFIAARGFRGTRASETTDGAEGSRR